LASDIRRDEFLITVTASGQAGWQANVTAAGGAVNFVFGPAVPPIGDGSAQLFTGTQGDEGAELRQTGFNGTLLNQVVDLRYWTYDVTNNGGQWPFIILNIDFNGDGTIDDLIFFEPLYQNGAFVPSLPNQGQPVLNTWQRWNALAGGWWSLNSIGGATPGTGVKPLSTYIAAVMGAGGNPRIVNSPTGLGGVRVLHGFASPGDVFNGFVDAFSIGTLATQRTVTYNFDPFTAPIPPVPPTPPAVGRRFQRTIMGASSQRGGDCRR
jgi:hypothetical protein